MDRAHGQGRAPAPNRTQAAFVLSTEDDHDDGDKLSIPRATHLLSRSRPRAVFVSPFVYL